MANRYDLLTVREDTRKGQSKSYFTRIGVAFQSREGDGFTLLFDALPIAQEGGQARVIMKPPRDNQSSQKDSQPSGGGPGSADLEDDIPFSPLRELP